VTENALPPLVRVDGVALGVGLKGRPFLTILIWSRGVKVSISPVVAPAVADALKKSMPLNFVSLFDGASRIHSAELKSKLDDVRCGAWHFGAALATLSADDPRR
jgi:hypothetical protein